MGERMDKDGPSNHLLIRYAHWMHITIVLCIVVVVNFFPEQRKDGGMVDGKRTLDTSLNHSSLIDRIVLLE